MFIKKSLKNNNKTLSALFLVIILAFFGIANSVYAQQTEFSKSREKHTLSISYDTRKPADTKKFPFSAIAKLLVTFPDGSRASGSGAFIGPNKVLTADHVVFDDKHGGDAKTIEVLPGYKGNYESCKKTFAKRVRHSSHQGSHEGANPDIAVITTEKSLGCDTGWFGFKQFSHDDLNDVFVVGYPADLSGGENPYFVRTNASHMENNTFHNILSYTDWTYEGMSGGPIFTADHKIIGIHTNGGNEANFGTAICKQFLSQIQGWVDED